MLKVKSPSKYRLWYTNLVKELSGNILDIGKSQSWNYGFKTIDSNGDLCPDITGDICNSEIPSESYDTILCNGMFEFVSSPQKMVNEVYRILKPEGTAVFGFVGKDYPPYKDDWQFYEDNIDFGKFKIISRKDFGREYHFITCKRS